MIARNPVRRRGGATTVEVAVVVSVFLMFLFGLFEYCRFLLMMHVATNAARDGARYAVVNLGKPTTFDTRDVGTPGGGWDASRPDPANGYYPSVARYVAGRLATNDKMMKNLTPTTYYGSGGGVAGTLQCKVEVFPCDPAQLNLSPPVVAKNTSATSWNQAVFGQRIAVRLTGDYKPVLPSFLMMGATIPMDVAITAGSEG